jgi:hypothetical protein
MDLLECSVQAKRSSEGTAAGYLAKYVGKDLARKRESGLHRYEVAQGFQPLLSEVELRVDLQTVGVGGGI